MKWTKLTTKEQFESLKEFDEIVVRWSDDYAKNKKIEKLMAYNIHEIKRELDVIICQRNGHHYFNYRTILAGTSNAKTVYLIESEE